MYFKKFNNILYDFNIDGKPQAILVKDITTNVRVRKAILENVFLFDEYIIRDGDTPEVIAAKLYNNPNYHWVVMLCNQKYHWVNDFPMSDAALNSYVESKYGDANGIHHYENDQGLIVSSSTPLATPITNYQYEYALNEKKRVIKLISPDLLSKIMNEFAAIMK